MEKEQALLQRQEKARVDQMTNEKINSQAIKIARKNAEANKKIGIKNKRNTLLSTKV